MRFKQFLGNSVCSLAVGLSCAPTGLWAGGPIEPAGHCINGECFPARVTNGFYPTRWRRWPIGEPVAPVRGVKEGIGLPALELPKPQNEADVPNPGRLLPSTEGGEPSENSNPRSEGAPPSDGVRSPSDRTRPPSTTPDIGPFSPELPPELRNESPVPRMNDLLPRTNPLDGGSGRANPRDDRSGRDERTPRGPFPGRDDRTPRSTPTDPFRAPTIDPLRSPAIDPLQRGSQLPADLQHNGAKRVSSIVDALRDGPAEFGGPRLGSAALEEPRLMNTEPRSMSTAQRVPQTSDEGQPAMLPPAARDPRPIETKPPVNAGDPQLPIIEYGPPSQSFMRWQKPNGRSDVATQSGATPIATSPFTTSPFTTANPMRSNPGGSAMYINQHVRNEPPREEYLRNQSSIPKSEIALTDEASDSPESIVSQSDHRRTNGSAAATQQSDDEFSLAGFSSASASNAQTGNRQSAMYQHSTDVAQNSTATATVHAGRIRASGHRGQENSSMTIRAVGSDADRDGGFDSTPSNPLRASKVIQATETEPANGDKSIGRDKFMVRPASAAMPVPPRGRENGNPLR